MNGRSKMNDRLHDDTLNRMRIAKEFKYATNM